MKNYVKSILLATLAGSVIQAGQVSSVVRNNPRAAAVVVATGIGAAGLAGGLALGRERAATLNVQLQLAQQEVAQLNQNIIKFSVTLDSGNVAVVEYVCFPDSYWGSGCIMVFENKRKKHLCTIKHQKGLEDFSVNVEYYDSGIKQQQFTVNSRNMSPITWVGIPEYFVESLRKLFQEIGAKEGLWKLVDNN